MSGIATRRADVALRLNLAGRLVWSATAEANCPKVVSCQAACRATIHSNAEQRAGGGMA